MNKIFMAVLFLPSISNAIPFVPGPEPTSNFVEVVRDTHTCAGLSISNTTATDVVVATQAGYSHVTVENIDTAANLWCSDSANVTTGASLTSAGWKLYPGQATNWVIKRFTKWYCKSDGSGSTNAIICKGN